MLIKGKNYEYNTHYLYKHVNTNYSLIDTRFELDILNPLNAPNILDGFIRKEFSKIPNFKWLKSTILIYTV